MGIDDYELGHDTHIRCPSCEEAVDVVESEMWELLDDRDAHDVRCIACGFEYVVHTVCTYSFESPPIGWGLS